MLKVKRFIAFCIDLYLVSFICLQFNISTNTYIMLSMIVFCFKDILFCHVSIGKKIMGLEIKTLENGKPSFLKLILRNITNVIWPVEALVILFKGARLSDLILKLRVVEKR